MVSFLIPFESALGETRVSATPETVKKFLGLGCKVFFEKGAGEAAGFLDSSYEEAGAELVEKEDNVFPMIPTGSSVSEIRLGIPSDVEIEGIRIVWNNGEVTTMDKWTLNRINVQNYDPDVNLFDEDSNIVSFIVIFSITILLLVIIRSKSKEIKNN